MAVAETTQRESRVKKTLLNARVNLIFYFLTLCLSFFSRKIFLDCLGADFVGLTGTLQNLLGFLNLAELGIGSAIGYVLYKPLFDRDQTKINEIISVMGYLYRWIGLIILGSGIILSCFLPLIFPDRDTGFHLPLIYFAYYAFLGSSLIGYFINYRQNLLGADQRNYVVTAYFQTMNIVKTIIQMALAYYTGNFYLWVAIEFAFGIIYSFILNWKINQTYPWLKTEISQGKALFKKYPEVIKYTKQLFVHKISSFVQFQTTPFLIYAFVNLQIVAFYGNYTLIVDKFSGLFSNVISSTGASVGNLIAEGNTKKAIYVFWELFSIQIFITAFCAFELFLLINPFITLWLGADYMLPTATILLILTRYFIMSSRTTVDQFIYGYGLFYDTWAPIAESAIFLSGAICAGYFFGLNGVLFGGILSLMVIVWGWKPIFLYAKGFKTTIVTYWLNLLNYYIVTAAGMVLTYMLLGKALYIDPSKNVLNWCVYGLVSSFCFIAIYGSLLYIFIPGARRLASRMIHKNRV